MLGFLHKAEENSSHLEGLKGKERVLDMADRMRRVGGDQDVHVLYRESEEAFQRGEIRFDEITVLFKHACIHSGTVHPTSLERFSVCPVCEARLDACNSD